MFNKQWISIGSANCLASYRYQVINWMGDEATHQWIFVSSGLNVYRSHLPSEISHTNMEFSVWEVNYVHVKLWYVIALPCPNTNGRLDKNLESIGMDE